MFAQFTTPRRFAGILALGIALLLVIAWMRSYTTFNRFACPSCKLMLRSFDGGVSLIHHPRWYYPTNNRWYSELFAEDGSKLPYKYWDDCDVDWRWDCAGFRIVKATYTVFDTQSATEYYEIPYWFLVAIVTAVAGYLVLPASRKRLSPVPSSTASTPSL